MTKRFLEGWGKSRFQRGCTTQYIPPFGSVQIQCKLGGKGKIALEKPEQAGMQLRPLSGKSCISSGRIVATFLVFQPTMMMMLLHKIIFDMFWNPFCLNITRLHLPSSSLSSPIQNLYFSATPLYSKRLVTHRNLVSIHKARPAKHFFHLHVLSDFSKLFLIFPCNAAGQRPKVFSGGEAAAKPLTGQNLSSRSPEVATLEKMQLRIHLRNTV